MGSVKPFRVRKDGNRLPVKKELGDLEFEVFSLILCITRTNGEIGSPIVVRGF